MSRCVSSCALVKRWHLAPVIAACAALAFCAAVDAAPPKGAKGKSAAEKKERKSGDAEDGVKTLYAIPWHVSLDDALKTASVKGKEKPVMCFRVLGDIEGFM